MSSNNKSKPGSTFGTHPDDWGKTACEGCGEIYLIEEVMPVRDPNGEDEISYLCEDCREEVR